MAKTELYLTREQVREIDHRAIEEIGLPGVVLMENAGRNSAEMLVALGVHGPVVICCGKGNNGGDGFVTARHLHNVGVDVRVMLFAKAKDVTGDAAIHLQIVRRMPVPLQEMESVDTSRLANEFARCQWIVDALFGTGLTGAVRSPFDEIIQTINASRANVLAVDIPSGLNCDTGDAPGPTIRADHTVTFVAPKVGFAKPTANEFLGNVHVADIGAPRHLLEEALAQE